MPIWGDLRASHVWLSKGTISLLPSGKLTVCYRKSPFLMGKSTISMAIFNSYVKLPEGNPIEACPIIIEKALSGHCVA